MVRSLQSETTADVIVLYSTKDGHWKLADLGSVADGTSKHFNTTLYSRGTACYRAPETLQNPAKYNNKADIWALGCIMYELCTGRKAFENDWATINYSSSGRQHPGLLAWPEFGLPRSVDAKCGQLFLRIKSGYERLLRECLKMLNVEPFFRPNSGRFAVSWATQTAMLEVCKDLPTFMIEIVTVYHCRDLHTTAVNSPSMIQTFLRRIYRIDQVGAR